MNNKGPRKVKKRIRSYDLKGKVKFEFNQSEREPKSSSILHPCLLGGVKFKVCPVPWKRRVSNVLELTVIINPLFKEQKTWRWKYGPMVPVTV